MFPAVEHVRARGGGQEEAEGDVVDQGAAGPVAVAFAGIETARSRWPLASFHSQAMVPRIVAMRPLTQDNCLVGSGLTVNSAKPGCRSEGLMPRTTRTMNSPTEP